MGDIIINLELASEREHEWRLVREAEAQRRAEEAERRREQERQRALERAREEALEQQVADWAKSRQIQEYVEAMRSRVNELDDDNKRAAVNAWLDWALSRVSKLNRWPPKTEPDEVRVDRPFGSFW